MNVQTSPRALDSEHVGLESPDRPAHALSVEAVVAGLRTDATRGLSRAEAAERLAQHGPNQLKSAPETPWWKRLLEQFENFLVIILLVAIVIVFFVIRLVVDAPHVLGGTVPAEWDFEYRYVANALLAYAHIVPGVVYLLLAPLQLWRGFRNRHLGWHRRIGRVAIAAGLLSGVFAIAFGGMHAWGGIIEALAAVLFGTWFIVCLVIAYRAIRRFASLHRHVTHPRC